MPSLKGHFEYFLNIFNRIPPQYLQNDSDNDDGNADDNNNGNSKYYFNKHQKSKSVKLLLKQASKEAKRQKLDPNFHSSNIIQHEASTALSALPKTTSFEKNSLFSDALLTPSASRQKIQEKIRELEQQRGASKEASMRKREEAKRKADAKKKAQKQAKMNGKPSSTATSSVDRLDRPKASPPAFVTEKGKMIFSKFDLGMSEKDKLKQRMQRQKFTYPSDPKQALEKIHAQSTKLNSLPTEKIEKIKENTEWKHAKLKASGEKVNNDPKLLEKALKRRQAKKAKSAREWADRLEQTKESQSNRQKVRSENISKRSETKKRRPGFEGVGHHHKAPSKNYKK